MLYKLISLKKVEINFISVAATTCFLFVGAYISFIILSGGDWMEGGRFIVPILPFISLFVANIISVLPLEKWPEIAGAMLIVVLQLGTTLQFALDKSTGVPINSGIVLFENYAPQYRTDRYSWFELTNRIHLRDIPIISKLDQLIEALTPQKKEKIQILTQQMGMVPYFLSLNHFGDITFTDIKGLTDRKFSSCIDDFKLDKSRSGLKIPFDSYLENKKQYKQRCEIEPSDIIYSLGLWSTFSESVSKEYKLVYQQIGYIILSSKIIHGQKPVNGNMFIAIKKDLLNTIKFSKTDTVYLRNLIPQNS